ncbi:MAG: DNA alkylation repair protein [Prolixibacteraceae bacterium]|nr:DNA alkylation repair protein [Prolixibacteraceae bacterium]
MPEKLKDILIPSGQIGALANAILLVYPEFDANRFTNQVLDPEWADRELKQKMRHITVCLKQNLPDDYETAIRILEKVAPEFRSFIALSFSDFVECYGLGNWEVSMNALAVFTCSCSSEFAVRPFLDKNPAKAMEYFYRWANHENEHIRRLSSEGCRPRLPWGMVLRKFKKDPAPILPILDKLKNDPSEYVRKSVSNNLNDISKDHPEVVLSLCEQWKGQSKETDRIIKHACRTMLKTGHQRALMLFGFANPDQLQVSKLSAEISELKIGEHLSFSFCLANLSAKPQTIRLEYRIHYVKANGKTSPKIFQISEGRFPPGEHLITKRQAFTDYTTRKHFPGEHRLEIVVNGETKAEITFILKR